MPSAVRYCLFMRHWYRLSDEDIVYCCIWGVQVKSFLPDSGGFDGCFFGGFGFCRFSSQKLVGLFPGFGGPFSVGLELFEVLELLYADDGPALREFVATDEGALLALAYYEFAGFAFVAFYAGGLGGRLWRENVAVFVDAEDGFTVGISRTAEEGAESAVLVDHGLFAVWTLMVGFLFL